MSGTMEFNFFGAHRIDLNSLKEVKFLKRPKYMRNYKFNEKQIKDLTKIALNVRVLVQSLLDFNLEISQAAVIASLAAFSIHT